jgi:cyclopropane fatty-acyl-phospholipid synthase-like methyltransferase
MEEKNIYKITRDAYNQGAKHFSNTRTHFWRDLAFLKDYISDKNKILDYGCGNGRLVHFLKKINSKAFYLGVDVSQNLIQEAKKIHPQQNFKVISGGFKEADKIKKEFTEFDLIISIGVFHHFPKGPRRERILKRLKSLLIQDGVLIATTWNLKNERFRKHLEKLKDQKQGFSDFKDSNGQVVFQRFLYNWDLIELEDFFQKAGFKVTDSGYSLRKDERVNLFCVCKKKS